MNQNLTLNFPWDQYLLNKAENGLISAENEKQMT